MVDYYAYFGFGKNTNMFEVAEKLALFLLKVREQALKTDDDKEKNELMNSALRIVQDVCRIFSVPSDKQAYDKFLREQIIISSKLYNKKSCVMPFEDFYSKAKRSWLKILTCLIPNLENEKQMSFLRDEDDMIDILTFIIENTGPLYANKDCNDNSYFILLGIVRKSFDIAALRGSFNVKAQDIVTSISNCKFLDVVERGKLAVAVFDKWHKTGDTYKKGIPYKKVSD